MPGKVARTERGREGGLEKEVGGIPVAPSRSFFFHSENHERTAEPGATTTTRQCVGYMTALHDEPEMGVS